MYNPAHFKVDDKDQIFRFLRKYSFGVIFTSASDVPRTASVPLFVDGELTTLTGHFAIANPIWKNLDGQEVLVVFQGPNHYISPLWYGEDYVVPTWNYVSAVVKGKIKLMNDQNEKIRALDQLSEFYEKQLNQDWQADWNDNHYTSQLKGIVAFSIEIGGIEMKRKLSQNHPRENTLKVSKKLLELDDSNAKQIGSMMADL